MSTQTAAPLVPFVIKVCGVTNLADAQAALDAGANALGFNFYPKSPRYITVQKAAEIVAGLRGPCLRAGVFVRPTREELSAIAGILDIAQIHGPDDGPVCDWAARQTPALRIWRAATAGAAPTAGASAEAWLLDSFTPGYGGSGKSFDWSLAAAFPFRTIVAGGLDAENVAEAIRIAKPWGVDSCSRLETAPGRKHHARVAAFVSKALEAFNARSTANL